MLIFFYHTIFVRVPENNIFLVKYAIRTVRRLLYRVSNTSFADGTFKADVGDYIHLPC